MYYQYQTTLTIFNVSLQYGTNKNHDSYQLDVFSCEMKSYCNLINYLLKFANSKHIGYCGLNAVYMAISLASGQEQSRKSSFFLFTFTLMLSS